MLFWHFWNSFLFFWDRVLEHFFDSFRIFLGPQPLAKHTPVDAKAHSGRTKAHSGKHIPTNTKARPNKHQSTLSVCALVRVGVCFVIGWAVLWYWPERALVFAVTCLGAGSIPSLGPSLVVIILRSSLIPSRVYGWDVDDWQLLWNIFGPSLLFACCAVTSNLISEHISELLCFGFVYMYVFYCSPRSSVPPMSCTTMWYRVGDHIKSLSTIFAFALSTKSSVYFACIAI